MEGFEISEDKIHKLIPIVESILSKKYGKKISLRDLTVNSITVNKRDCAK
ncbi:hypothetical protein [Lysinibacillus sphaericus]|nr:hypothetical protein [Lysinibacillus sphaericus]